MSKPKKLARIGADCVACGCCVLICPKNAVHVHAGIIAQVDDLACIGCGKCAAACPAAVITLAVRREEA